ncbi:MAG TPA: FKBP-type peptidyl-prolyl cis-trans isomerase [Candidatus Polarisedimenticolaceae bacterium]|nr:FKBP-type peptidyl-prolyl cis-trans isomerase [Candidatus Polarisedimenticolaceae bacterium]
MQLRRCVLASFCLVAAIVPLAAQELQPKTDDRTRQAAEDLKKGKEQAAVDAIPAPDDVAAAPKTASRTKSGLATRVIGPGKGQDHPQPNDMVVVRYTGWTSDGKMFDTTVPDALPAAFTVHRVIPGLREGLLLMVEGEKRRMWIPAELAYKGTPDKPQGMLVYDVELQQIVKGPATPPLRAPASAQRTPTGLAVQVVEAGNAAEDPPREGDIVTVHLNVWNEKGKLLDTTVAINSPRDMTVGDTVPGLTEGLTRMHPSGKLRLWMPAKLATLEKDKAGTPLIVEVQLISVQRKPVAPPDVAAPPADAARTSSGVAYKVIKPGAGDRHPKLDGTVRVSYAGWTTDGKVFDSSFAHGKPGVFKLDTNKPQGWNEMLEAMSVGERRRFWVPEALAYAGKPDRPQGMLVFEVELLEIQE